MMREFKEEMGRFIKAAHDSGAQHACVLMKVALTKLIDAGADYKFSIEEVRDLIDSVSSEIKEL